MRIVNPLYDKAFKYLMENEKYARKVLSVILNREVVDVNLEQQETVVSDENRYLTLFRLDFKATIQEANGEKRTVLIELQKSKFPTDIRRFRNYLASGYMSKMKQKEQKVSEPSTTYNDKTIENQIDSELYPIITIYILGYKLAELPYLAVKVNRRIVDAVSQKEVNVDSSFIKYLTHESYIIQVQHLPEKRKSKLERFFTLFNQAWCTDEGYIIDLQDIPEEYKDIARHLHEPVEDESFRRHLQAEEEIDQIFRRQEAKFEKRIEKAEQEAAQAKRQEAQAKKQQEEERRRREEEHKKREDERKKREEERKQRLQAMYKLAWRMKQDGDSIEQIMEETGLSREEIKKL